MFDLKVNGVNRRLSNGFAGLWLHTHTSSDAAERKQRTPTNRLVLEMRPFCWISRKHHFFDITDFNRPVFNLLLSQALEIVYQGSLEKPLRATVTFTEQTPGSPKVLQKCALPLGYCGRFIAFTFTIKLAQSSHQVTSIRGNRKANIFVNVRFRGVEAILRGKAGRNPG